LRTDSDEALRSFLVAHHYRIGARDWGASTIPGTLLLCLCIACGWHAVGFVAVMAWMLPAALAMALDLLAIWWSIPAKWLPQIHIAEPPIFARVEFPLLRLSMLAGTGLAAEALWPGTLAPRATAAAALVWALSASGSIAPRLARQSQRSRSRESEEAALPMALRKLRSAGGYAWAALAVIAATAVCLPMRGRFDNSNLIMVYLLAVALVATRFSRGPAAAASGLSVAAFDFFFVHPHLTFAVEDTQYLVTFTVMLIVALLVSDLTVRVREHAEAAHTREREAEAARLVAEEERLRSTLLSSVSHDFRTPLAAIAGASTSLLEDGALDALARRELLETIADESRRLNRLVTNLLEMTRVESGLRVAKKWLSVEEAVGSALERVGALLDRHVVTTSLASDLPLVPVDPSLLEQVLVNLLENASRHTPAGVTVAISAWPEDHQVVIEVADDGPGVPPGEHARIFEKFRRPGTYGGFGLGLAICRAMVEAHGGRIWLAHRASRGTAFRFTIPLSGGPPAGRLPEDTDAA
jgi:two-component system sensor histidine kinase KdpD